MLALRNVFGRFHQEARCRECPAYCVQDGALRASSYGNGAARDSLRVTPTSGEPNSLPTATELAAPSWLPTVMETRLSTRTMASKPSPAPTASTPPAPMATAPGATAPAPSMAAPKPASSPTFVLPDYDGACQDGP